MAEVKITLIQRTVDAPAKEYLSRAEAAAWIGISPRLFQACVDDGTITAGEVIGGKKRFWHWTEILAYLHARGRRKDEKKPSK